MIQNVLIIINLSISAPTDSLDLGFSLLFEFVPVFR